MKDELYDDLIQHMANIPNLTIESICREYGLSNEEMADINCTLKSDRKIMARIGMNYPRFVEESCKFVTEYANEIEDFLSGKRSYPLIVEVHPGAVCNLNCIFCFSRGDEYTGLGKKVNMIPFGVFYEFCADLKRNDVREIWFSGGKEPLTNKNTMDFIDISNSFGFITRLYTNGLLLNTEHKGLQELSQIRISVNAAMSETYCKICGLRDGGQFAALLDKIGRLSDIKKNMEKEFKAKICVSFLIQELNYHEMIDFYNLMSGLGVDSIQYRLDSIGRIGKMSDEMRKSVIEQAGDILYRANKCGDSMTSLRGIVEGEFDNDLLPGLSRPKICMAGLVKRGIDPFFNVFFCEYSSHPYFSNTNSNLKLGNMMGESFSDIMERSKDKFPPVCEFCQAHEYGLNVLFEKLVADKKFGFALKDQIFYRGI